MAITVEKALLNNQSILQNFGLVEEIDEQAAEILSGGAEKFTIKNLTQKDIVYSVDGLTQTIKPGQIQDVRTSFDGKVTFDRDTRENVVRVRRYNLSDNKVYEFTQDQSNPDRIDLYGT